MLLELIESYQDIEELNQVLDKPDLEGLDSIWYLEKYKPKKLLNSPIIIQLIEEKWSGKIGLSSVMEYSVFYRLLMNREDSFNKALTFDKPDHIAKFQIWKKSLKFKFMLEAIVVLLTAIFLQIFVNKFNQQLFHIQE